MFCLQKLYSTAYVGMSDSTFESNIHHLKLGCFTPDEQVDQWLNKTEGDAFNSRSIPAEICLCTGRFPERLNDQLQIISRGCVMLALPLGDKFVK